MANTNLTAAKKAKNDEFYTQFADIEREVLSYLDYDKNTFRGKTILLPCDDPEWSNFTKFFIVNFKRLGLKKLISTSYAPNSNGRIFSLTKEAHKNGKIDWDDIEWDYLKGDGDFRSEEVKGLRHEADIIVTNPPFSLFREFMAWVTGKTKKLLVIGSMNAITYKEIFPLIKGNKLWIGSTKMAEDMVFAVPPGTPIKEEDRKKAEKLGYKGDYTRLGNSCWFTNLEHGRRHQPLTLMTQTDVERFGMQAPFQKYDNYDAIEVPKTKWIPSDYKGAMGVHISFLDKYCPEQFEIVGMAEDNGKGHSGGIWDGKNPHCIINGESKFKRIFIRHKNTAK